MARPIRAALVERRGGPFEVRDAELDGPYDGQVLVRMRAVGICHTDLSTAASLPAGLLPALLGHEGAGVVEEVGSGVRGIQPGDTVALTYRSCGRCPSCASGAPAYCTTVGLNHLRTPGRRPGGVARGGEPVASGFFGQSSFATYALTSESNTIVVPADVPPALLAPLGCSVQTGAGAVLNVLEPSVGETVVVFGAGAVGMCAVMAGVAAGADVIAVDPVASRRTLATELGARAALDPADDVVVAVRDLTGGGARHAVDTTGRPEVVASAIDALGARGRLRGPRDRTAADDRPDDADVPGDHGARGHRGRLRPRRVHPAPARDARAR